MLFESNIKSSNSTEGIETVYMLPGGEYGRHVRCRNCHLTYVNPIEVNGKISEDYSRRKSSDASIISCSRLKAAKSQVQLIGKHSLGVNLLDIGCGEGFFLFTASKMGHIVRGVELSCDAVEYARREFNLDVEARPFEEVEYPAGYFDIVTLWQVLEHVPQPLVMLRKVHRILKSGGILAVTTPDFGGILARILGRRWWNIRKLHVNQFTDTTLKSLLRNAGFTEEVSIRYKEHISLPMLVIPMLRYLKVYESLKGLACAGSITGRIAGKIVLAYPSSLDNCGIIAMKPRNNDKNCNYRGGLR